MVFDDVGDQRPEPSRYSNVSCTKIHTGSSQSRINTAEDLIWDVERKEMRSSPKMQWKMWRDESNEDEITKMEGKEEKSK